MKIKPLLMIAASALIISCSNDDKKDSTNPTTNTPQVYLTAKDWKMTAQTVTMKVGGKDTTIEVWSQAKECEKDDLIKYNADKTIIWKSGSTKCDATEPDYELRGTWALINNNLTLRSIDDDTSDLSIVTLNATTFVGKKAHYNGTQTVNVTITLTAQ